MSSGVISITDEIVRKQIGDVAFEALVQARRARPSARESSRARELQALVTGGVAWTKPPPAAPRPHPTPRPKPTWSKKTEKRSRRTRGA